MQSFTYLSLFSGIGGFELGFQQALADHRTDQEKTAEPADFLGSGNLSLSDRGVGSANCVGFSEINPAASQIYRCHFPTHPALGDITKIDAHRLPDFDLLCGGFPCQSFSFNGKRRGLNDPRGALFFDITRIIQAKRPRLLLLENVRGFLSDAGGQTARTCFALLHDLGYDCQWQVLNGKDFGQAQNRDRVYIVGHRRGQSAPSVFPFFRQMHSIAAADRSWLLEDCNAHRLRRLTPLEYERLQGFPDGWTVGVPDSNRYGCLANAVSPLVVREIASRLLG